MISFSKLPKEYQQVEYIENTGQSYINTGFTLNQDSKVEMVVYSTNFAQGHLFGSRESATSKNFTISDGHLDFGTYTKNRISFNTHADNLKTTLTIDKTTFKVDNESYNDTYQLTSVDDFTCISPAYIFYVSGNPYGNYRVWGKLYSCKIWDNGTLARNFIPCYRKSDDEVGLYDLVNDIFYTNAGTGTFSKGENIVIKNIVINNKDVKKLSYANIPIEYQEVEYIESSGTQYINTTYVPTNNTKWVLNAQFNQLTTQFNGRHDNTVTPSGQRCDIAINSGYFYLNGGDSTQTITADTNAHTFVLDMKNGIASIDNSNFNLSTQTFNSTRPVYLFARRANTIKYYCNEKIYNCKFYENDILSMNLIPCYRKSDNEIGMYDTVGKTFYTNKGTGVFTKGNDIEDKIWWEKPEGGNIFDPTTATVLQAYFENGVPNITSNAGNRVTYVACQPNTTYEIKKLLGRIFWVGCTVNEPDIGVATTSRQSGNTDAYDVTTMTSMTFTTDSTANYLVIRYTSIWIDGSANESSIFNSIEVYER